MTRPWAWSSSLRSCLALAAGIALASGCAAPLFVPPTGPGEPAPDAAAAWTEATETCRRATQFVGVVDVSGSVAGRGLPHIQISTGASPAGMRLEARAGGQVIFKLAGSAERATLHLQDGNRVVTARADAIVDALIGAKIGPAQWFALVGGCLTTSSQATQTAKYGDRLAITTADGRVFLDRGKGGWRLAAFAFDRLIVSVAKSVDGAPVDWTLSSEPGREAALKLHMVVRRTPDVPVGPEMFVLQVPADAVPMTLDELRDSGPLRRRGSSVPGSD